jgi:hypothetical protein
MTVDVFLKRTCDLSFPVEQDSELGVIVIGNPSQSANGKT